MYVLPGHINNHNDEEAALLLDLFEDEAPIGQRQSRVFELRINNEFLGRTEKIEQRFRLNADTLDEIVARLTPRLQQPNPEMNHALSPRQTARFFFLISKFKSTHSWFRYASSTAITRRSSANGVNGSRPESSATLAVNESYRAINQSID